MNKDIVRYASRWKEVKRWLKSVEVLGVDYTLRTTVLPEKDFLGRETEINGWELHIHADPENAEVDLPA